MRNPKQLEKRNAKLLYRHNYLLSKGQFNYGYILELLAEEFYLKPQYVEALIKELSKEPIIKPRKTLRQ
jgi:hypothetical protein